MTKSPAVNSLSPKPARNSSRFTVSDRGPIPRPEQWRSAQPPGTERPNAYGRAQRAFPGQLAADAGYEIDWSLMDADQNEDASEESILGKNDGLRHMIDGLLLDLV